MNSAALLITGTTREASLPPGPSGPAGSVALTGPPMGQPSPQRTVAGAVRVVDHVNRSLLSAGAAAVNPGVPGHRVRLRVLAVEFVRVLGRVLGHQTARARVALIPPP